MPPARKSSPSEATIERRRAFAQSIGRDLQRTPAENVAEYADIVDQIRRLNAQVDSLEERKRQIEAWAIKHASDTGIDKFSTSHGTLSVSEKMRACYETDRWNDILLSLVGIDYERVRHFAKMVKKALSEPDHEAIEYHIRCALTPGNLHVIQRRLTDAKVEELAISGIPLPNGLRLEPYDRVYWAPSRNKVVENEAE